MLGNSGADGQLPSLLSCLPPGKSSEGFIPAHVLESELCAAQHRRSFNTPWLWRRLHHRHRTSPSFSALSPTAGNHRTQACPSQMLFSWRSKPFKLFWGLIYIYFFFCSQCLVRSSANLGKMETLSGSVKVEWKCPSQSAGFFS